MLLLRWGLILRLGRRSTLVLLLMLRLRRRSSLVLLVLRLG